MTPDVDRMIDDCIEQLADERVDEGVDLFYELAVLWKSAALSRQSFIDICHYIQTEAGNKSDETFVQMKITAALKKARENKHGIIARLH